MKYSVLSHNWHVLKSYRAIHLKAKGYVTGFSELPFAVGLKYFVQFNSEQVKRYFPRQCLHSMQFAVFLSELYASN